MITADLLNSIFHSALPPYVLGKMALGETVTVRLRASAELAIYKVLLRCTPEGEEIMLPLHKTSERAGVQWWETEVTLNVPQFDYRFWVFTADGPYWLAAGGCTRYTPLDYTNFKLLCLHHLPDWVLGSVFYQIFPDRFCNGDDSLSVKNGEYFVGKDAVEKWEWHQFCGAKARNHVFLGGDIPGIISRLDYLQELGVTAIYLNPIFTAPSNHKYDVADYYHVDPHLGGDAALIDLRRELSRRGMRLVLDIVPNHCGNQNAWFKAAQRSLHAPEADFFTFRRHPNEYECWLGVDTLPRLNYANQLLRERMYEGEQAIMRYWLRPPFSIDGWRIDVANMLGRRGRHQLGHKVGRAMRRAVKEENSEAWILGEHFFDGTSHLQGDELDATMNYRGFTVPLLQWLCGRNFEAFKAEATGQQRPNADYSYLPTADFVQQLNQFRAAVPERVAIGQFNLLDSHDTPRFYSMVRKDLELFKLALVFLFTYPGVPCIYYGDEIGMEGGGDPDCRRPMEWDRQMWNQEVWEFYRLLIGLRRSSPALQQGSLQFIHHDCGVVYLRETEGERWLIALNRGRDSVNQSAESRAGSEKWADVCVLSAGIADGTRWQELFTSHEEAVHNCCLAAMPRGVGAAMWREITANVE
ncbi:MAG: maltodextrin glucosidase [bacterium]|nr:maltodextrin glucosidase [bacterium]